MQSLHKNNREIDKILTNSWLQLTYFDNSILEGEF